MTIFNPHIYCKLHCHSTVNPEKRKRKSPFLLKCRLLENKTAKRIHYTSCDILNPFRFFFFRKSWLKMERELEKAKLYAYNLYGFKFTHISCDILNPFRFFFLKIMVQNGKREKMKLYAYNSYGYKFAHIS